MRHYFVATKHDESEYFTFNHKFNDKQFVFRSCPDVFSKDELDYGSLVLIKSVIEHSQKFGGKIMDMCCGYGTIAILLSKFIDAEYHMSDINSVAVELARDNIGLNHCNIDISNVRCGDLFEGIENNFNHVVSNPPIKAGKKYLLQFVDESFGHLCDGGTLTLVIKKNLGADSLKKYLISVFGNCEVWERDKGFYILHSCKTN